MAAEEMNVRVEERLKIKIGEAKNLQVRTHGSLLCRDVYCILSLDQEEIFRTATIEKTLSPFFGEEYQFEVPRKFRYLSVYVYDRDKHLKQDKVLGKVAIKREDLASYNNKDHWFSIRSVDADSEVQGKVNIDINSSNNQLTVRVVECLDLTLKNGSCDPYALVTVSYTNGKRVSKRTKVRKKTVCPQFDETFHFEASFYEDSHHHHHHSSHQHHHNSRPSVVHPFNGSFLAASLTDSEVEICELNASIWHDGPSLGDDVFLGEVRIQLRGVQVNSTLKNAWYFLQPRSTKDKPSISCSTPPGTRLSIDNSLGSLRLQVQYTADHVFPSDVYDPLRKLLLQNVDAHPINASPVYILGELVSSKMDIAKPLVRIFLHHEKIVPVIKSLADAEIANLTDATTIFRGNTLVSKMMDEAMRIIGLQYLHKTLRPTIEQVFAERKPCEIDPTRVRNDPQTIQTNLNNLLVYVQKIFKAITESAVHCPALMCRIFSDLRRCAMDRFPDQTEVRYSVVSGFIFLRFFAPAILGPKLFELTNEQIDHQTNRTLTLISKTIQSLGNLVSCRSTLKGVCKEEYMECVYREFCNETHVKAVRQFLEIISANPNSLSSHHSRMSIDTPVVLKEGVMIKRAQGRKRFGRKNFKRRYFRLTTHDLSYSKTKGREALCHIPLGQILAVEPLQERSFKMKNMFQIVQAERALYVQAPNCVEAKEWIDLLTKICQNNANRLKNYHPCAFINGHWLCCNSPNELAPGCSAVSPSEEEEAAAAAALLSTNAAASGRLHFTLDPERDLQRLHSLIVANISRLDQLIGDYVNHTQIHSVLAQIRESACLITQKHLAYQRMLARDTKYGSKATPIGDDNYLLASRMNLDSSMFRKRIASASVTSVTNNSNFFTADQQHHSSYIVNPTNSATNSLMPNPLNNNSNISAS